MDLKTTVLIGQADMDILMLLLILFVIALVVYASWKINAVSTWLGEMDIPQAKEDLNNLQHSIREVECRRDSLIHRRDRLLDEKKANERLAREIARAIERGERDGQDG